MKQAKAPKKIKNKLTKGTNVRLSENNYILIKEFCDEKGYKIGAFIANAALKRVYTESEPK